MCLTRNVHAVQLELDFEVTLCPEDDRIGVSLDVIRKSDGETTTFPTIWWSEEEIARARAWRYLPAR